MAKSNVAQKQEQDSPDYGAQSITVLKGLDAVRKGTRKLTDPDVIKASFFLRDIYATFHTGALGTNYTEGKALFALGKGLQEVVKASIVGSIVGNILLVLGAPVTLALRALPARRDGSVGDAWRIGGPVQGIPSSYFLDASGVVQARVFGPMTAGTIAENLAKIAVVVAENVAGAAVTAGAWLAANAVWMRPITRPRICGGRLGRRASASRSTTRRRTTSWPSCWCSSRSIPTATSRCTSTHRAVRSRR